MTTITSERQISRRMDVDAFMAFLESRPQGEYWDLIEGHAVMMAPPSIAHQRIAQNLCNVLNGAFAANSLDLFAYVNIGVRIPDVRDFQSQPDVAVLWGMASFNLYAERFLLAAEVLSPTNTRREIGRKLRHYREAPENLYALVIEPRAFAMEIYARHHNWERIVLTHPQNPIEMPEFGLHCQVMDIYRGTPLGAGETG